VILPGTPQPLGALTLRWPAAASAAPHSLALDEAVTGCDAASAAGPDNAVALWQALASDIAPILAWQSLSERPWHWHLRQAAGRAWRRSRLGMRTHPRRAALALVSALAVLGGLPLP